MGIILALASTFSEIKLVSKSKFIERLYTNGWWKIDGFWFNTIGSFGLSAVLGIVFTADGLIAFFAGALSTGMSQAYFSTKSYLNSEGWDWPRFKTEMMSHRDQIMAMRGEIIRYAKLLIRAFVFTIKVITAPFRFIDWCIKTFDAKKNEINKFKARFTS